MAGPPEARAPGGAVRRRSLAALAPRALILLVAVVVAGQAVLGLARVRALDDRRHDALVARAEGDDAPLRAAGARGHALRVFGADVRRRARTFALVTGPDVSADDRRTLALVTAVRFYPAIAVSSPGDADALLAFGDVPASTRAGFVRVAALGDGWLGMRG